MEIGIVGLPNVGKSTMFNAITKAGAECANYPFCTIEPNVGVVSVPDKRLDVLEKMYNTKKKVYTAKPMTPEDAVLQMNLLGHNFYIFCNIGVFTISTTIYRGSLFFSSYSAASNRHIYTTTQCT